MNNILPDGEKLVIKNVISCDNVRISYQSLGESENVIVLSNGLGGRIYTWEAIIRKLYPEYRIISWDYRSLFDSKNSECKSLSIPRHAKDLKCILDNEGISNISTVGWSMGVQVSLEFVHLYPEMVDKMVLICGTYGNVLDTGLQPLFKVPYVSGFLRGLVKTTCDNKTFNIFRYKVLNMFESYMKFIGNCYSKMRGNDMLCKIIPKYLKDNFECDFNDFMKLILELDKHSTYDYLDKIYNDVLIMCGVLDILTPSYQSKKMHKKLPNSELVTFKTGTHLVPIEFPKEVPDKISDFLNKGDVKWL